MPASSKPTRLSATSRPVQHKALSRHVIILVRNCSCLWHRWHKHVITLVRFLITGLSGQRCHNMPQRVAHERGTALRFGGELYLPYELHAPDREEADAGPSLRAARLDFPCK